MDLLNLATTELFKSNTNRKHPFRYFYLATLSKFPQLRTVVKRDIDSALTITVFTDARTPKVAEIQENPHVSALFYHPKKQLQLRLSCKASIVVEGDPAFAPYLQQVKSSPHGLKDYTTLHPPGAPKQGENNIQYGERIYLAVLQLQPLQMDIVRLQKEQHLRSTYSRIEGEWQETALVP